MHYRDLFVLAVVGITLPKAWRTPFIGLLCFSWLAYMRPQDLCWGFATRMRFSYMVALVMLTGYVTNDSFKRKFTQWDIRTRLITGMWLTIGISVIFARFQRDEMYTRFFEFGKIVLITLFTVGQVDSRARLRQMMWVILISLGFFGVKNGIYGILSGGSPIIQGPGGMLYDNNDFALALVMMVPIFYYMSGMETNVWIKRACWGSIVLTVISILLTHSRGGFLSMSVVMFLFWLRSRKKMLGLAITAAGLLAFFTLTPQSVFDRLATLQTYEEDASAMGRLMAWSVAFRMIGDHPFFGVGLYNFRSHFGDYIPLDSIGWAPVAHNSYLQIWAEAGTLTFVPYVILLLSCFWTLGRLRRLGAKTEGGGWILNYARMLEASFAGFVCGAMFLNRGHFDLVYQLMAVVAAFNIIATKWSQQPVGQREGDMVDEERKTLEVRPGRGFGNRAQPALAGNRDRQPIWRR